MGAGVGFSMDRRGLRLGNVLIERLWRLLKHKCIHRNAFVAGSETRAGISRCITCYNGSSPQQPWPDEPRPRSMRPQPTSDRRRNGHLNQA